MKKELLLNECPDWATITPFRGFGHSIEEEKKRWLELYPIAKGHYDIRNEPWNINGMQRIIEQTRIYCSDAYSCTILTVYNDIKKYYENLQMSEVESIKDPIEEVAAKCGYPKPEKPDFDSHEMDEYNYEIFKTGWEECKKYYNIK